MSMFTTSKTVPQEAVKLVLAYIQNGGKIKTAPERKRAVKTFLNHSYRGTKSRTLRFQGFAKAN